MEKVCIKSCDSYDIGILKEKLSDLLKLLDINITKDQKILVKPNFLIAKKPDSPSATNPKLIQALLELLLSKGAKPILYEIPGFQPIAVLISKLGLKEFCKKNNIKTRDEGEALVFSNGSNKVLKTLALPSELKQYDLVINLAKLKTHSLMGLTLGVKNMFGLAKQDLRTNYHFKAGRNTDQFADIIIDIYTLTNPGLTIIDGIIGMEGNGPSNGTPRRFNLLAASKNAFSLDAQLIHLLGRKASSIPIQRRAIQRKIKGSQLSETKLIGDRIKLEKPIKLPASYSKKGNKLKGNLINLIYPFFEPLFATHPKINKEKCIACYRCIQACPAKTIKKKNNKPEIHYNKCIRCFCCHEMCPVDAISIEKTYTRRLIEKLVGKVMK